MAGIILKCTNVGVNVWYICVPTFDLFSTLELSEDELRIAFVLYIAASYQ